MRVFIILLLLMAGCATSDPGKFADDPAWNYVFSDQNGRTIISTWIGYYRLEYDGSMTPVIEVDRKWVDEEK